MMAADYVIDISPGAGVNGGKVIAEKNPDQVQRNSGSITGQYLSGEKKNLLPRRRKQATQFIKVINACENNFKNVNVKFPTGNLICVTGILGGGKSSIYSINKANIIPLLWNKYNHVVFLFSDNTSIIFNDPRRFGLAIILSKEQELNFFDGFEIEPLTDEFNGDYLNATFDYSVLKTKK